MATETELQTLASWLESQGFALKKRRDITLSYLNLVFGHCTAPQLKAVCRTLRQLALKHDESQKHKKAWEKTRFRISWLALRRMTDVRGIRGTLQD